MTRGARRPDLRARLLALIAGPVLVLVGSAAGQLVVRSTSDDALLGERAAGLEQRFFELLVAAGDTADSALAAGRLDRRTLARGPLGERFEGAGLLTPDGAAFLDWTGTPAEPPAGFLAPSWPRFSIRLDGVRTRLLARAGPDEHGRFSLATFIIDSTLPGDGFLDLLEPALRDGVEVGVTFHDTRVLRQGGAIRDAEPDSVTSTRRFQVGSPGDPPLATFALAALDPGHRAGQIGRTGAAWAVVAAVVLAAVLFDWRNIESRGAGAALAGAAVLLGRTLAAWSEVPQRLLPRDLASASIYGAPGLAGWLASPADLLLTAIALFMLCVIASRYAAALAVTRRWPAVALAAGGSLAASGLAFGLIYSLALNSRVALVDRPAPFVGDERLLLWLIVVLTLLGAAELWVRWLGILRAAPRERPRASRWAVTIAIVLLAALASFALHRLTTRFALEQLSSEFAPQVLQQSSRRGVLLYAALGQVADRLAEGGATAEAFASAPAAMAYHYWSTGELFQSGYRSSLEFYTPAGDRISEFGFGLPPLDPHVRSDPSWGDEPRVLEESAQDVSKDRQILHGEMRFSRAGQPVGMIVAHMLDEPENLPFLPWSQPYLPAMGPGAPRVGREFPGDLQYVLYDADGAVRLTTMSRPPAESGRLRAAGEHQFRVEVATDDGDFVGLALTDEADRLHLLLLPAAGVFDHVAVTVRTSLIGVGIIAFLALVARVAHRGGLRSLFDRLASSYYRKLLAFLLVAAVLPLIALAFFIRGYVESRADRWLISSASQLVGAAQRVIEDYASPFDLAEQDAPLNDEILYWLRGVVGQEIHVYEDGVLLASSMRELFRSGLLPPRLDGEVRDALVDRGLPTLVVHTPIGPTTIPVAYAPVPTIDDRRRWVVAVPLVLEQRQIGQAISRVREMILVATVALVGLLAGAAALLARTVARPVRELVEATGRVAAGDYSARLEPRTRDEVGGLGHSFNEMAAALERQRSDLRRQRDYMEILLRHDTTGVVSLDANDRVVTINPAAARVLGLSTPVAGVGRPVEELLGERPELAPLARVLAPPLGSRSAPTWTERSETPIDVDLIPDDGGAPRRFRVVRVELRDEDATRVGTLVLLDDVTDLMRSNQLAAWAEMARVIAHEIKNPLTPIQLSSEHLRRLLEDRGVLPAPEIEACLCTIIKQVRTLHEIAREFSAYAKLPALSLEPTDPVAFVRAAVEPYRAASPSGVRIVERYGDVPPVAIDKRVLSRAVVNLIENALQAMPDGGELVVAVAHDARRREVVLSIKDSGPGLDPEVRLRLFEPYFSTKSSGTGLGLAIVQRAVEGHGGRIDVESRPRHGTAFRIHLPVAA
jgi:nitrogen fixation/metabolism regulation signal transduction histidine kinase